MKLRIRGNSLRLRLTRSEVARLAETGRVEDAIRFGPGDARQLRYTIAVADVAHSPHAEFPGSSDGGTITVFLPPEDLNRWLSPDQVGIEARQGVGDGQILEILIEKDFACLDARPGDEDADAFPNPAVEAKC